MRAILQRVSQASVVVDGVTVGQIGVGLLVYAAIEASDTPSTLAWTARKLAELRVFPTGDKAFELNVREAKGAVLLISNFTVAAETAQGRRPSLFTAMTPSAAEPLFAELLRLTEQQGVVVQTGQFGAHMLVNSSNDGPITFVLQSAPVNS